MRKTGATYITSVLLVLATISCNHTITDEDYLKKVLSNLEKIESASYYNTQEAWRPNETIPAYSQKFHVQEYRNPTDTTIGSSYVQIEQLESTQQLYFAYDGTVRLLLNHDVKAYMLDDFTIQSSPWRPVSPPFFNYTESIIKYILTTNDSITTETDITKEYYHFKWTIHEDKQVYFFGKPIHYENSYYGNTSLYEIWIDRTSHLPYKVRLEMEHTSSEQTLNSKPEINKTPLAGFNLYDYIPQDYESREYGKRNNSTQQPSGLIGKKAPDWMLKNSKEQNVSLSNFKSKVLMINITGIGCGPCVASLPFLKELKESYDHNDFDLVAIETWSRKPHSIESYKNKHSLNYTMLCGTDDVIKNYRSRAVPAFFILDEQRIIRYVSTGFTQEKTDKEIIKAINDLL